MFLAVSVSAGSELAARTSSQRILPIADRPPSLTPGRRQRESAADTAEPDGVGACGPVISRALLLVGSVAAAVYCTWVWVAHSGTLDDRIALVFAQKLALALAVATWFVWTSGPPPSRWLVHLAGVCEQRSGLVLAAPRAARPFRCLRRPDRRTSPGDHGKARYVEKGVCPAYALDSGYAVTTPRGRGDPSRGAGGLRPHREDSPLRVSSTR